MSGPDFTGALDEYEALLDRIERALDDGDWSAFEATPPELPSVEGALDAAQEERLRAAVARGAKLRDRLETAAREVAEELTRDRGRGQAHRRYTES